MVVDSILPNAENGPNDHRKDAPHFNMPVYDLTYSWGFSNSANDFKAMNMIILTRILIDTMIILY